MQLMVVLQQTLHDSAQFAEIKNMNRFNEQKHLPLLLQQRHEQGILFRLIHQKCVSCSPGADVACALPDAWLRFALLFAAGVLPIQPFACHVPKLRHNYTENYEERWVEFQLKNKWQYQQLLNSDRIQQHTLDLPTRLSGDGGDTVATITTPLSPLTSVATVIIVPTTTTVIVFVSTVT